ncbi:8914_t:CDS:2 [Rhizophagus irregularis]|nr:8914_t:CDS:2 [Rhizophagus irregularis]
MTPIPSTCPSNYPYKLSLTLDCFGYFPTNNRGRDNTIQSRLSDFFPPDRDDDIGMTEKRIK